MDPGVFFLYLSTYAKTLIPWMGIQRIDHIEPRFSWVSMRVVVVVDCCYIIQPIELQIRLFFQERENVPDPALFTDDRSLVLSRNDVKNLFLEPIL